MSNHIFIVHTAFQQYIAENSVQRIKKNNSSDKFILMLDYQFNKIAETNTIWDEIVTLTELSRSSFGLSKEKTYRKNAEKIIKIINKSSKRKTTIYLSDIQWPLNNRVFFDERIKNEASFNMIIDGLMAYHNPQKSLFGYIKDIVKLAAGFAGFGLKYKPYLGSAMGWERKSVNHVYGIDLIKSPIDETKHVNIDKEIMSLYIPNNNKAIFLDQPYHNFMSEKRHQSLTLDTIDFLKSNVKCETYYKPHHASKIDNSKFFENESIKKITETECIEKIIATHGFGTIISYNSSALITLKLIYKDKITCIALNDSRSRIKLPPKTKSQLTKLFEQTGVEIHAIGQPKNAR